MVKEIMKTLGFTEETIKKAQNGDLVCSTHWGLKEPEPFMMKKLAELKQQFGEDCQFYHVMEYSLPIDGDMRFVDFLMYCPEEWEAFGEAYEMDRIRNGEVRVYTWDVDEDTYSEVGPIGVKMMSNGALKRIW